MAAHTAFTGEETGTFSWYSYENYHDQNMTRAKAFSVILLVLSGVEFLLCIGSLGYGAYAYKRDEKKVRGDLIIVAFLKIFSSSTFQSSSISLPFFLLHLFLLLLLLLKLIKFPCSEICERARPESVRAALEDHTIRCRSRLRRYFTSFTRTSRSLTDF